MIGKERRKCAISYSNFKVPISESQNPSKSSLKSEMIDKIVEKSMKISETPRSKSKIPGPPPKKRMTIEETLQVKNNLRFNSFQKFLK